MSEAQIQPEYALEPAMAAAAAEAIAPFLRQTPVLPSPDLSELAGRPVYFKCENQQATGSFKVRGALTRLARLEGEDRLRGVVASSAGNHGLGVAWACRHLGIPGLVVVPEGVSPLKLEGLRRMLIKVRRAGACYDEAEAAALELAREAEATFVSPFDDPWVMAGNGGTVGLELLDQLPGLSLVVTPVGGGGLASGLGLVLRPRGVELVGVNCAASPAMARTLAEGVVHRTYDAEPTLAEGLEGGVSASAAAYCQRFLCGVEVVDEEEIRGAIRFMARAHGVVIEGSAAVAVALLRRQDADLPGEGDVCVILSGRNIHKDLLEQVLGGGAKDRPVPWP